MVRRKQKRREHIAEEWNKVKHKFLYLVVSGIISYFIVPVLIGLEIFNWGITFAAFGFQLDLDPFVLYIVLTLFFYILLRIAWNRRK